MRKVVVGMRWLLAVWLLIGISGCPAPSKQEKQQSMSMKHQNWKVSTETFSVDIPLGWYAYAKYKDTVYLLSSKSAERVMIIVNDIDSLEDPSSLVSRIRKEAISTSKDGKCKPIRLQVSGHVFQGIEFVALPQGVNQKRCKFFVCRSAEIISKNQLIVISCFLPDGKESQDMRQVLDSFRLMEDRDE